MRSDRRTDSRGETGSDSLRDDDSGSRTKGLSSRQLAVAVALVVLAVDQVSKAWAVNALVDGPIRVIDGLFQLRLVFNTGASFSLFSNAGPILAVVAVGVVGVIFYALGEASKRIEAIGLGLVLGGSIGNLTDRVFRGDGLLDGAVVDFLDVRVFTNNFADVALFIGVALLLFSSFVRKS